MKYVVFTFSGYGLPIAWQLQNEGREVRVGVIEDILSTRCSVERELAPEVKEEKQRRLSLYDGLLEKHPASELVKELRTEKNPEETFLFFDLNHCFSFAEELKDLGFQGNFPLERDYLYEIDRDKAKDFVTDNYPLVHVAQKHKFSSSKAAHKFLTKSEEIWVLKGLAEDARTVVPDVTDPELAQGQILDALAQNPDEYESAGFLLELLIPSMMELTPQKVYYNGVPIYSIMCVENKPMGAGNIGPMTDCAQDIVFSTELESKINAIAFPPIVDSLAKEHRGLFYWDASLLINSRTGKVYFSEFCSNRPGYNCLYTELALCGSPAKYFESLVAGKNPHPDNTVAASIRLFNFQRDGAGLPSGGASIQFKERAAKNLWLYDVRKTGRRLANPGYTDTIGVVTGSGRSVTEAAHHAQRSIDEFSFEGAYYRPEFDLVSTDYQTSILNRLNYGLSRGFYKVGFALC